MRRWVLIAVLPWFGCGPDVTPAASQQQPLRCGSEPAVDGNGLATSVGCAFEQQADNFFHFGTRSTGTLAASGMARASVEATCGTWVQGTDADGVTVFVDTASGAVRSHGAFHAGFATSALPQTLSLPLTIQTGR